MGALPRLLYIGDVPVESACAGGVLLYRLFSPFTPGGIRIIEGDDLGLSTPAKRLPNTRYQSFRIGRYRLLCTRFYRAYSTFLCWSAEWKSARLRRLVRDFKPDAIVTAAHGYSWIAAARVARDLGIPLHLVIHDDWRSGVAVSRFAAAWPARIFAQVYRQARSRLCVSPYMEENYRRDIGESGTVLYPSRASDVPAFGSPPERIRISKPRLVFGFGGGGSTALYAGSLVALADVLARFGSTLRIYSYLTAQSAAQLGLDKPNVELHPVIPSNDLIAAFRKGCDALFVPLTFDKQHEENMRLCFPSKLADYTAAGLPILVWGPEYSSAIRWAKENAPVAEVLDSTDASLLRAAVERLHRDPELRYRLGQRALDCGREYFSFESATDAFRKAIAVQ